MAYMEMKRIYEVQEHDTLFNICSYLIVCSKSFFCLSLFVVPEVPIWFWSGLQGMCLTKEQKPPMYIVAFVDCLWARVVAALLWPLHMLAKRLIYKKIHSSIGISKVVHEFYFLICFVRFIIVVRTDDFGFHRLVLAEVVVYPFMLTSFLRLSRL